MLTYPDEILSHAVAKNIQYHLQFIGRLLSRKADYSSRINKRLEIKSALDIRCANYKDDPKKMINSIIDHHQSSIVIDRLLINEENTDNLELITDPDQIKKEVNKHFQLCALPKDSSPPIPEAWQRQYEPRNYIQDNLC